MKEIRFNKLSEYEKQIYMEALQKAVMNDNVCFEAGLEIVGLWEATKTLMTTKITQNGPTVPIQ